jgi:hypothetical protein
MKFHLGTNRQNRSHRGAGALAVQDLRRRPPHRRRVRLRVHRHPIPARPQGSVPASDLVEGILNNSDRPPVKNAAGEVIRAGQPLTHFNEVDECAGLDGLIHQPRPRRPRQPVENTLHDLRWGDWDASGTTKNTFGSSSSRAARRPRTTLTATRAPTRSASRRCISASAAAPCAASPNPVKSSGAASSSKTARSRWTSAAPRSSRSRAPRPTAAGKRRPNNGRSCTPSPTASRATR